MQYKVMVLALLLQRPQMQQQLRKERKLLETLENYAQELEENYEAWRGLISSVPGYDPKRIRSRAMELAVQRLEDQLPPASPRRRRKISLYEAVAFIIRHTSPD
ncbi:MAG TPA: hypothetical protein VH575_16850 [Gemmataceae bacterium]